MHERKTLLYKDKYGNYIPYNSINKDLCVLYGNKNIVLNRVKMIINRYYNSFDYLSIINENTLMLGIRFDSRIRYTLCNIDGKIICDYVDSFVNLPNNKLDGNLIAYNDNNKYGYIDITTGKKYEKKWKKVKNFYEGLAPVQDSISGKWGYINEKFELVIDYKFDIANEFSEGMGVVGINITSVEDLYKDNIVLTEKDKAYINEKLKKGKSVIVHGYINKNGEFVIPYSYSLAHSFQNGLSFTKTFEEEEKSVMSGGAFINKNNDRSIYFDSNPVGFFNGGALLCDTKSNDKYYFINDKTDVIKMDYNQLRGMNAFFQSDSKNQSKYRVISLQNKGYLKYKLFDGEREVRINLYDNIAKIIDDFYDTDNNCNACYGYDFELNQIVQIDDFYYGYKSDRLDSSYKDKSYVKTKKIDNWFYFYE